MTRITIYKKSGHISKVICLGHTGFGVEGEDIVCAALSSIVQTALLGLLKIAAIEPSIRQDDAEGLLEFALGDNISSDSRTKADIILDTMQLGILDLYEGFSKFIAVKEVKEK